MTREPSRHCTASPLLEPPITASDQKGSAPCSLLAVLFSDLAAEVVGPVLQSQSASERALSVDSPIRAKQPDMRPRLVLFGDSITEQSFASGGWGAALTDRFARQADVVLRGLSGYNTRWALKVLPRAMEGAADAGADPAAVTVFFGANDASLPDQVQAHQHVTLQEYQSNLRAICAYFKERWPSTAIILITPPPIYEPARIRDMYGEDDPSRQPERSNEAAGAYAQACIAVATELNHPVIDIWTKMQEFPDWQTSALSDGLHFTPAGNKILFDEVVKTLASIGFSQERLPSDLPLFHEIDPKDPMKAFGA